jgi:hypothetical protein
MELVTIIGSICALFTWLRSTHKTETFLLECDKLSTLAVAYIYVMLCGWKILVLI